MKKLMIAAAGAGKTTFLVTEALKIHDKKVWWCFKKYADIK